MLRMHTVAPELRRRVRVDSEPSDRLGVTGFRAPHLGPAEEHPLHAGQSVDHWRLLAAQRELIGQQCDGQTTQVADVLPDGERAVHVVAGGVAPRQGTWDEVVVLLDESLCAAAELTAVGIGPPVDEVAVTVVFGALIVEAVPDLMPDHGTDATVVGRVVGLCVEERWLQDRGREHDLVHARVVIGVDGLRRHEPLVAVHRPAELGQFAVVAHLVAAAVVAVQIIAVGQRVSNSPASVFG